jgi:hypothetical protein
MIDRSVEPLVRECLAGVVVADRDRFEKALKAISGEQAESALSLILQIDRMAMDDLHDGQPSDDRLRSLARQFVEMQDWYDPSGLPVENFLRSLTDSPGESVGDDVIVLLAFLVGGWLLAAFLNPGTHWYQYLDDILDRLDV